MSRSIQMSNVLDIIHQHSPGGSVKDKSGGREYIGVCPFCGANDKFSFNIDKNVGRCYRASCEWSVGGNAAKLTAMLTGTTYAEAKANLDNGVMDERTLEMDFKDLLRSRGDRDIMSPVYSNVVDAVPLPYYRDKEEVYQWIESRGHDTDWFLEHYEIKGSDSHEGRACFIISSEDSEAYILYSMRPDLEPKTINPPHEILSRFLFNRDNISGEGGLFIVEGLFDAIRLFSYGLDAVAVFGTSISERQQIEILSMNYKEVVVCFDGDAYEKAVRNAVRLNELPSDAKISVMRLKDGEDPDSIDLDHFLLAFKKRKTLKKEYDILSSIASQLAEL